MTTIPPSATPQSAPVSRFTTTFQQDAGPRPGDRLDTHIVERNGTVEVRLTGQLDHVTTPMLERRLERFWKIATRAWFDLSGVDLIDSRGIGFLYRLRSRFGPSSVTVSHTEPLFIEILGLPGKLDPHVEPAAEASGGNRRTDIRDSPGSPTGVPTGDTPVTTGGG